MMSLPILNSRFFQEHRPDLGFFSKWSSFYTWSEQLLPVYEWQDILYVGCSRPPKSFPIFSGQKVVLVLCEPGVLQDLWLDFQAPSSFSAHVSSRNFSLEQPFPSSHFSGLPTLPESQELTESLEDDTPDFQHLETVVMKNPRPSEQPQWSPAQDSEIPNLDLNESLELDEKTAAVAEAIPEGLSLDPAPVNDFNAPVNDFNAPVNDFNAPVNDFNAPVNDFSATPNEFNAPADEFKLEASEPPAMAPFELQDDVPAESQSDSEETEAAADLLDLNIGSDTPASSGKSGLISLTLLEPSPSTPTDLSLDLSLSQESQEATEPMVPAPTAQEKRATPVSSESLMTGEVTRIAHRALDSVPKNNLEPWLEKIFQQMDEKFEKTMVLLKTGDQVRPWKWDANFEQDSAPQTVISLVQPSPFRIVARTKKPYHGYVVASEQLQKFCVDWNFSQTPEHLTIAPILVEDHVVGLVLAVGSKAADTKDNLMLAEMMALEMARKISATAQPGRAA